MTKEQYLKEVTAIRKVIAQQKAEIKRIEAEYIEANKPCNVGDRFSYTGRRCVKSYGTWSKKPNEYKDFEQVVECVGFNIFFGEATPVFVKVKKNGEISQIKSYVTFGRLKPIKK